MKPLIELFQLHPYLATSIAIWLFNNVITAAISSFAAPTKDDGPGYLWWFKFSNTVIGNIKRAQSTAIEKSPNWRDAVVKHIAENSPPNLERVQE